MYYIDPNTFTSPTSFDFYITPNSAASSAYWGIACNIKKFILAYLTGYLPCDEAANTDCLSCSFPRFLTTADTEINN